MCSEAYDNEERRPLPPLRAAGEEPPRSLSDLLDRRVYGNAGAAAFFLRSDGGLKGAPEYLSLTLGDLAIERDAWLHRLRDREIEMGDRILLAAPLGLEFLAASYACLKLGAELIVLDPAASWKACEDALRRLEPRMMIGTRQRIAASRKLIGGLKSLEFRIQLPDRPKRIGSPGRTPGYGGKGANGSVVLVDAQEGQPARATRFHGSQLMALAQVCARRFSLRAGSKTLPTLPVYALLNPALGIATVMAETKPPDLSEASLDRLIDAVSHLEVTNLVGSSEFLDALLNRCSERSVLLKSLQEVVAVGMGNEPELLRLGKKHFRPRALKRIYAAGETPIVSVLRLGRDLPEEEVGAVAGKGYCLGEPLPETEVRIVPIDSRNSDRVGAPEKLETRGIGEIAVRGVLTGAAVSADRSRKRLPNQTRWNRTGDIGFQDGQGRLWYCGRKEELVVTSFGTFYPDRCQLVFDRHPKVARSALIPLRKDGKARPGIVVETSAEDFPKKKLELARFSAELLQLGKDLEETRLITEFYFVRTMPLVDKTSGQVDREALSARFSKKARF